MGIELKRPALSPTREEGTLARGLVKEGDQVSSGDVLAEIETDKATMEFESIDEGTVGKILVEEGTEGVKVGTVIAMLNGEGEEPEKPSPLQGRGLGEGPMLRSRSNWRGWNDSPLPRPSPLNGRGS